MGIALILCNICVLTALIGGYFYVKKRLRSVVGEYNLRISDYFNKADPKTGLSEAQTVIQVIADKVVGDLTSTLAAQSRAASSHVSRQANLLAQDMVQDQVTNENPILGMFLQNMPSVKKRLAKNPAAVQAFLPMIQDLMKPGDKKDGAAGANFNGDNDWMKRLENG